MPPKEGVEIAAAASERKRETLAGEYEFLRATRVKREKRKKAAAREKARRGKGKGKAVEVEAEDEESGESEESEEEGGERVAASPAHGKCTCSHTSADAALPRKR